jgi:hypothetical protein
VIVVAWTGLEFGVGLFLGPLGADIAVGAGATSRGEVEGRDAFVCVQPALTASALNTDTNTPLLTRLKSPVVVFTGNVGRHISSSCYHARPTKENRER